MHEVYLQGLDPQHVTAVANTLMSVVLGFDTDVSAGTELFNTDLTAPHGFDVSLFGTETADPSIAPFEQVAANNAPLGTYDNPKPYTHIGADPVGHAHDGKSAIADAYEGSKPGMDVEKDPSSMMQSGRALADQQGFSDAKRAAFLERIQNSEGMQRTQIPNGTKLIVADGEIGGRNSAVFETKFKEGSVGALKGEITYTEGGVRKTETVYIIEGCANPAVDAAPDQVISAPAPVEPVPAASMCVDDWKWKPMSSVQGVDFGRDIGVVHDFDAYNAPSGMTEDEAIAVLSDKTSAENLALRNHYFWVFTDVDCDGHPEKAECVWIDKDGNVDRHYVKAKAGGYDYDRMTIDQQKKFLTTP